MSDNPATPEIPGVADLDKLDWRASAGSLSGEGARVAKLPDGRVLVKVAPDTNIITFGSDDWEHFTEAVRNGQF